MIEVLDIRENEDGSADVTLNLEPEEAQILIEKAVVDILQESLKDHEDLDTDINTELMSLRDWDEREEDLETEKYVGP